jgi:tRNA A37 methylthiotransferase MiaB
MQQERPGRYPGQFTGRSPTLHPVQVRMPASSIGEVVTARVTGEIGYSLFGEVVER